MGSNLMSTMRLQTLLMVLALLVAQLGYAANGTAADLTAEQARQELDLVVAAIHEHHPDPFHATDRATFEAAVATLRGREGPVTAWRQYFDLMKVASLVSDTHTQFHITDETPGFEVSYPLRFRQ